jgi:NCS1 family nucleobase:cation symporter-1
MQVLDLVFGGIGVGLGLGLWGTISAMIVGTFLGSVANTFCVTMGPRLGMPQLVMGRSTFGYVGNFLPAVLSTLLYVGYFAVNASLGAHTAHTAWNVPYAAIAAVIAFISIGIGVLGHDRVHDYARWLSRISAVVFIVLTILAIVYGAGPSAAATISGGKYWAVWLLELTVVFAPAASFGPYASDYSRYLPAEVNLFKVFGYAFAGLFVSKTWVQALGALLATIVVSGGAVAAVGTVSMAFGNVAYVVMILAILIVCVLNLYSGAMSILTWDMPVARQYGAVAVGIIGGLIAVFLGGANFQDKLKEFLEFVAYFVTPWITVTALDYYWVHRVARAYGDVTRFYVRRGPFGLIRWDGIGCFLVGVGASIPFMANSLYTGPVGVLAHGADVSYFVSAVVAGLIYVALHLKRPPVGRTGESEGQLSTH